MNKKILAVLLTGLFMFGITGIANAIVINLYASQDTWIYDSQNYSHGTSTELRANDTSVSNQFILTQFDISSLISEYNIINSASISLYRYDGANTNGILIDAHEILSAWEEDVFWTNQPGLNPSALDTNNVTSNGWYNWDITSLVQEWVNGTTENYGVAFYDHGSSFYQRFYSSEASRNRPFLTVDYETNHVPDVPEPATFFMFIIGLLGFLGVKKKTVLA